MTYKIIRITAEGFLKDIGYKPYTSYLKAENVVKELKRTYPKRNFIIQQVY